MKQVALGAKIYFVREEGDPEEKRLLFMVLGSDAPPITRSHDVFTQDGSGRFVPVYDEFTVAQVKAAVAGTPPVKRAAGRPEWEKTFGRWLDDEIAAGRVVRQPRAPYGPSWHIPRTKKDVHGILELKIPLSTFSARTRPSVFKHKGLPVLWVNRGGAPKRANA